MAATTSVQSLTLIVIILFYSPPPTSAAKPHPSFNVQSYGAKPDGKSDSSKAFLAAWSAACAAAPATVYVPPGKYAISTAAFSGNQCKKSGITIQIDGTLVAPSDYGVAAKAGEWLRFDRVAGVTIRGGTLDGQGAGFWACRKSGKSCPKGATSLGVYNSNKVVISGLKSMNSQMFHISIFGSYGVKVVGANIMAPGDSPNTDGIHIEQSSDITIKNSNIGTGDDCISIGPGTSNLWIETINCGPGHGVSIGSLGRDAQEPGVHNVTLRTATFTGTENGVRIKTWSRPSNGFVKDVLFQHVTIKNANNPIIIDQNYCPSGSCPHQGSGVKITNVKYQDIHGASATQVAMKFDCSNINPCTGITLDGVDLTYLGKPAMASCSHAVGKSSGVVHPAGCFD
ncbi:polygalacturonase-like [Andrographis paniculata]|uniref:polygalacturonase-like n=1 Tax=Andrographis paniculata TaxID=175694 RepID=UPI0021E85B7F|nr:polygalacturonase-like [Andrographis paniculata]